MVINSVIIQLGTVLLLGDSHLLGQMGRTLRTSLESQSNQVAVEAVCGATVRGLAKGGQRGCQGIGKTEPAAFLLAKHNPRAVIISAGSNSLLNPDAVARREIRDLLQGIGQTKCLWIAPPSMRIFKKEQIARYITLLAEEVAGKCRLVDYEARAEYPSGGDGVHYSGNSANNWAMLVYGSFLDLGW